ncbi:hypothetical protein SAMN06295998_1343 [Primorskyibacter flagellatus]|uniref:Uncharacterized protein n=1 Tax=Primorskyibacter flagellatus TaxID=1387277 RepID=A0A1W2EMW1_9RHOB|nr:hypothetical protein SAMN06295998_1343 [Primorskyibacter flagellatus]
MSETRILRKPSCFPTSASKFCTQNSLAYWRGRLSISLVAICGSDPNCDDIAMGSPNRSAAPPTCRYKGRRLERRGSRRVTIDCIVDGGGKKQGRISMADPANSLPTRKVQKIWCSNSVPVAPPRRSSPLSSSLSPVFVRPGKRNDFQRIHKNLNLFSSPPSKTTNVTSNRATANIQPESK